MPAAGFFRDPDTPSHAQDRRARERYVQLQAGAPAASADARPSWPRRVLAQLGVRGPA